MVLEDEFGDIIAKARAGVGLSRAELADRVELTEADISKIEAYDSVPASGVISRLAEALGLDAGKLNAIANNTWSPEAPDMSAAEFSVRRVQVPVGQYSENAYVVACKQTKQAAVVDPGGAADEILKIVQDYRLNLILVLITHTHSDHIGGLPDICRAVPDVTVVSTQIDRQQVVNNDTKWLAAEDGRSFEMGKLTISSLTTPGHTAGSVCYGLDGACFVGDTMFAASIGRPAVKGGYYKMLEAIKCKILALPPDTALLPGHGPITTVAQERRHNPFF